MHRIRSLAVMLLAATVACEDEPATSATGAPTTSTAGTPASGDATATAEPSEKGTADPATSEDGLPAEPTRLPVIEVDDPDAANDPDALSQPAAFDLIAAPTGAILVWANDDAILAAPLSEDGRRSPPVTVAKIERVAEIAAAASSTRVAVIWIAGDATLGTAHALTPGLAFGPARALGPTEPFEPMARGRIEATATADGRLLALARTADEPCQRYDAPICANFGILDLVEARARRRPGLEIPHPCTRPVAGFAVTETHWHYAVCHHEGPAPTTVLFTAQQTPSYAQTNELLMGCQPRGITRGGDDLWVSGTCGGGQRAVHVRNLAVTPGARSPRDAIACADDELTIRVGDETVTADAQTVGLGALLPADIVPAEARAVWTGRVLLVARAHDDKLSLERHECRDGTLQRTAAR